MDYTQIPPICHTLSPKKLTVKEKHIINTNLRVECFIPRQSIIWVQLPIVIFARDHQSHAPGDIGP